MALLRDISLSAVVAGFVTVLVGFTSSAVIVFQAAQALGASPAEVASWMWALGLGMGLTCIGLSLRYRVPVVTAWSTPGAAMLITSAAGVSMPEAIGAFVVCGALLTLFGFTGWFERAMQRLPLPLASAMLAGVLLRFGLDVFVAMQAQLAAGAHDVRRVPGRPARAAPLRGGAGARRRHRARRRARTAALRRTCGWNWRSRCSSSPRFPWRPSSASRCRCSS